LILTFSGTDYWSSPQKVVHLLGMVIDLNLLTQPILATSDLKKPIRFSNSTYAQVTEVVETPYNLRGRTLIQMESKVEIYVKT
jgi:hypothetical protein